MYQQALKAEKTHHYITEKKLLKKVLRQFPNNFEAGVHYLIAAVRSNDFAEIDSLLTVMADKTTNNKKLIEEANSAMEILDYYNLKDPDFAASISEIAEEDPEYDQQLTAYYDTHREDVCALFMLGKSAFNRRNYAKADSLFNRLATFKPDFHLAFLWLANTYIEEKKYDGSIKLCERVLEQNAESHHALAIIAKTMLKQQRDKEALQKAMAAYELNPDSEPSIYTLAMANHFNNRPKERDQLFAKMKTLPDADTTTIAEMTNIFSGKISYR
ncbi:MAG: tetratricopeptide repeat protein [Chitinophaga sp.]|uniref:tetratricopeptide repeat protein n=1 Tax=Chitinophaga sp. TaxID=1869181 RepID=UPI001B2D7D0D|nr:tetratricopeptide repeat protein [Chitinophaga sp.]MBO9728930.1 tetratricopeptide repeat protein [Chitinophaga sp.]